MSIETREYDPGEAGSMVFNRLYPLCTDYGEKYSHELWKKIKSSYRETGVTQAVGWAGPPGSGKTTMIEALIADCEREGLPYQYVEIGRSIVRAKTQPLPDGRTLLPANHMWVPMNQVEKNYRFITALYEQDVKEALRKGGIVFFEALVTLGGERDERGEITERDDGTRVLSDVNSHSNAFSSPSLPKYDASFFVTHADPPLQEKTASERDATIVVEGVRFGDVAEYMGGKGINLTQEQQNMKVNITVGDIERNYWHGLGLKIMEFIERENIKLPDVYRRILTRETDPKIKASIYLLSQRIILGSYYKDRFQRVLGIAPSMSDGSPNPNPNIFIGYNRALDELMDKRPSYRTDLFPRF